jgi:5-(carboxyamino)imidazole ribonucleotide mutase
VATMAVGGSGAANAALFAVAVLALGDKQLATRLAKFRAGLARSVRARGGKAVR